jgi:hypothetical protein
MFNDLIEGDCLFRAWTFILFMLNLTIYDQRRQHTVKITIPLLLPLTTDLSPSGEYW